VYYTSAEQLRELQALASKGCKKRPSKLQSFSAFLWQLIASHACHMGKENANMITKMGIVVDGKHALDTLSFQLSKFIVIISLSCSC